MASPVSVAEDMALFFNEKLPVYVIDCKEKRKRDAFFPEPGYRCKVRWTEEKYKEDWRADGYLWRQEAGGKELDYNGGKVVKYYFKLRIFSGESGDKFTREFTKRAYKHPDYPNEILILYDGNASVVNPKYSHGNSKKKEKKEKPYFRTAPSVIQTAKERLNEAPSKMQ